MRTVEEHRTALLALVSSLPPVTLELELALGRVLACEVVARVDLPGFDNSAMDGYAVRSADVAGAAPGSPALLPVEGDIAAGDTRRHELRPGTTMRIMTGAPLPAGADAVVPVEHSDGGVVRVALTLAPEPGRHLRRRGEDIREGDVVLGAGVRLTPGRLALAAAANVPEVQVVPRPRVSVLSTGDELVPVGLELAHGRIVDSNGPMLAALIRSAGARLVDVGHLDDEAGAWTSLLERMPGDPDLLLTTGGVSMGAYDTVKEVLTTTGTVDFTKVAMRPGMPQGAGVVGPSRTPIITLPGNPVSSFVSFHVFVLPVLRALAGLDPEVPLIEGVAARGWSSVPGKVEFSRVVLDADGVRPSGGQGSHMLGALADATHLAVVDADTAEISAGDTVRLLPLLGQDEAVSSEEGHPAQSLTHVRADGSAHMVDVSAKAVTAREASARGRVLLSPAAVGALRDGTVPKGDALAVARLAGIQAVKRTPELIPLAHPVAVHAAAVDLEVTDDGVDIAATVRTADRTGIEMEALTAVSIAALALIDMVKAVDKHARITDVRVTAKSGGRSGDWVEP